MSDDSMGGHYTRAPGVGPPPEATGRAVWVGDELISCEVAPVHDASDMTWPTEVHWDRVKLYDPDTGETISEWQLAVALDGTYRLVRR